ncbi:MAG: hypothetical protein K2X87_20865 [Gemmataceae bacterium]|nr:hypothetical protein [Gemmataceae bacterium]
MDTTDLIADEPGHRDGQPPPAGDAPEPVAAKFARLKAEWEGRTKYLSNINQILDDPAYQAIIGMGWDAVPLLLADLRNGPNFWHTALKRITGENPVPADVRGNQWRIAVAWLEWGWSRGY